MTTAPIAPPSQQLTKKRDISGFVVFSHGEAGRAHVRAHHALDTGRMADGYQELLHWLGERPAQTSELVHLHWHLLLFEIAVGRLDEAGRRLERHVLPAVVFREAATDAPAALWRLRVAGHEPSPASWRKALAYARIALSTETRPFVVLHHLLAVAGAGDHGTLSAWLRSRPNAERSQAFYTYALGLEALACGDLYRAADVLVSAAPKLTRTCRGSQAQNALFVRVAEYMHRLSADTPPPSVAA